MPVPVAPKIVISYRRSDSLGISGRIYDRLKGHYGETAVFMDVASNRPGYDYRREIKQAMQNCQIVIAIIGPKWSGGGKRGHTRITDPDDAVRSELESAFRLEKPIMPVLVAGTRMPAVDRLPESLKELTFIHAAEVDEAQDFDFHIQRLIGEIDQLLAANASAATVPVRMAESGADEKPAAPISVTSSSVAAPPERATAPADISPTPAHPTPSRTGRFAVAAALGAIVCVLGIGSWLVAWHGSPTPASKVAAKTPALANVNATNSKPAAATAKLADNGPAHKMTAAAPTLASTVNADKAKSVATVRIVKTVPKVGGIYSAITISPLPSEGKPLRTIAFSPNHRILAVGGDDGIIRLWDANTFQLIKTLPDIRAAAVGRLHAVRRISFTSDGSKIVAAGFENAIRIWDVASGTVTMTLSDSRERSDLKFYSLAVHAGPELQYVMAGAADGEIRIWNLEQDLTTPAVRKTAHAGEVFAVRYSPAVPDDYASGGRDGKINIYTSGHNPTAVIRTDQSVVFHLQYSPLGDELISAGTDRTLKLWRISDQKLIRVFERDGHKKTVLSADISPDGSQLLSGSEDTTIKLWNIATASVIRTFTGHKKDVEAVAFHPNGKWIVSVSEDGMLKVWDIASGKELLSIAVFDDDRYIAFTPKGSYTGTADITRQVNVTYLDGVVERNMADGERKSLFVSPEQFAQVAGLN
jgi:WD40 repeat protein